MFEPDNGLLRLFLPAASSWQEQSELYETAYAEADAVGLRARTRRAQRDDARQRPNSYTTLTLGGPTPASSPFLNHPQLLRSLIAYWQNHPCLSYLFSGTLIGPSGNAPRPDEGRDDALYELGIALVTLSQRQFVPSVDARSIAAAPVGGCIGEHAPRRDSRRSTLRSGTTKSAAGADHVAQFRHATESIASPRCKHCSCAR